MFLTESLMFSECRVKTNQSVLARSGLENTPFSVECAAALTASCVLRGDEDGSGGCVRNEELNQTLKTANQSRDRRSM